jgi:hypothetical protein
MVTPAGQSPSIKRVLTLKAGCSRATILHQWLEILGREAEAENVYRKGIRVFFDYSDTWVALGIVLAKQVQPPSLYCVWKSDEG